ERRSLPFFEQLLIELLANLLDELLDARRMNASILHEALERDAGDLAADRIEAGENDRFRRVVDDEIDAGRQLERADVTAFASDDAALHVLAREIDDGDGVLRDVIRSHALNGHAEDLLGFEVAELVGFGLDALDDLRCFLLRLFDSEAGDLFELVALAFDQFLELVLTRFDLLLAFVERAVALLNFAHARIELCRLLVEIFLFLLEPLLRLLHFVAAFLRLAIEVAAHLQQFFFRLEVSFLDAGFRLLAGVLDDAIRGPAGLFDLRLAAFAIDSGPGQGGCNRAGNHAGHDTNQNRSNHSLLPVGRPAQRRKKSENPA